MYKKDLEKSMADLLRPLGQLACLYIFQRGLICTTLKTHLVVIQTTPRRVNPSSFDLSNLFCLHPNSSPVILITSALYSNL